ncbi:hypothetical protein F5X96DRAFT_660614 [Biscogniauxia mediterranea]|nr:hypothetical protein F5X96DRAFT_660614 [Biscogniauxia mediterranea]
MLERPGITVVVVVVSVAAPTVSCVGCAPKTSFVYQVSQISRQLTQTNLVTRSLFCTYQYPPISFSISLTSALKSRGE